jgi:four helix bundle protein
MRRSAIAIPSNIADGQMRRHQTEFKQFLHIALGSLAELETQLIISRELGYVKNDILEETVTRVNIVGKQIRNLIKKLTTDH